MKMLFRVVVMGEDRMTLRHRLKIKLLGKMVRTLGWIVERVHVSQEGIDPFAPRNEEACGAEPTLAADAGVQVLNPVRKPTLH